jgi:hypothetical protein
VGVELELTALLVFAVLGQSTFARFEIETPASRKILKWFMMAAITLGLSRLVGHDASRVLTTASSRRQSSSSFRNKDRGIALAIARQPRSLGCT